MLHPNFSDPYDSPLRNRLKNTPKSVAVAAAVPSNHLRAKKAVAIDEYDIGDGPYPRSLSSATDWPIRRLEREDASSHCIVSPIREARRPVVYAPRVPTYSGLKLSADCRQHQIPLRQWPPPTGRTGRGGAGVRDRPQTANRATTGQRRHQADPFVAYRTPRRAIGQENTSRGPDAWWPRSESPKFKRLRRESSTSLTPPSDLINPLRRLPLEDTKTGNTWLRRLQEKEPSEAIEPARIVDTPPTLPSSRLKAPSNVPTASNLIAARRSESTIGDRAKSPSATTPNYSRLRAGPSAGRLRAKQAQDWKPLRDKELQQRIPEGSFEQVNSGGPPSTPKDRTISAASSSESVYPAISDPEDVARALSKRSLRIQRAIFCLVVLLVNAACLIAALESDRHLWVFIFILFIKSKDVLSTVVTLCCLPWKLVHRTLDPPQPVPGKWILSMISAYAESEEQIMKTIDGVRKHDISPHKQVICVILDGKPRDIKARLTRIMTSFRRPYVTWKNTRGELTVTAGLIEDTPILLMEKTQNAGKKDSIVLCHDLFNAIRDNAPLYTHLLRKELSRSVMPQLAKSELFPGFDMIFCTDADSTIHEGAIAALANAIVRDENAVAACGVLFAEMMPGAEWSPWHLYQQFQYTFGQYVRRQAEGLWGKVTCLPGCISMIAIRPEMAGAIKDYARPITARVVLPHQVQYLGTDRRLTYCMLSQDRKLRTIFVSQAVCETVAPQSLRHYLSQRRRWASNAYFNNIYFCFGSEQIWITRFWSSIDFVRLSMIYYRVANTIMFIHGLVHHFLFIKIVPMLIVTQLPTIWYLTTVIFREPTLRKRAHKLVLGLVLNEFMSAILSIMVFTNVALSLGTQVWGRTGISTEPAYSLRSLTPNRHWTPNRLATLVRRAINGGNATNVSPRPSSAIEKEAVASVSNPPASLPRANTALQVDRYMPPTKSSSASPASVQWADESQEAVSAGRSSGRSSGRSFGSKESPQDVS